MCLVQSLLLSYCEQPKAWKHGFAHFSIHFSDVGGTCHSVITKRTWGIDFFRTGLRWVAGFRRQRLRLRLWLWWCLWL